MDEASITVNAPPEQLWALVTDVTQMGRWSPECVGCTWTEGAAGPVVGARFKGRNRRGPMRWTTHCEVVAADEPTHFAFQVRESGMRWGYRFEPAPGGGTVLTEYRDRTRAAPIHIRAFLRTGALGKDREGLMVDGMRETLERVKAAAES